MKNNVSEQICAGQEAFHIHHITKAGELITPIIVMLRLYSKQQAYDFPKTFPAWGLVCRGGGRRVGRFELEPRSLLKVTARTCFSTFGSVISFLSLPSLIHAHLASLILRSLLLLPLSCPCHVAISNCL